jgi:nitroreductase
MAGVHYFLRGESMNTPVLFTLRRTSTLLALAALLWTVSALGAQELKPIQLPKPQITAGMTLMQALAERKTTRAFLDKPLPPQTLSNLLWAAFGVNRPRTVRPSLGRTAPSGNNKQEVELYVVLAQGVYIYEAETNLLRPHLAGDLRARMGESPAGQAAATLVFVAGSKEEFAQVDTGFIGQNVYLFAASEGLNAWFYSFYEQHDATAIATALKLPKGKIPLYAQSVGYPPK